MKELLRKAWASIVAAQARRAQARALAHLDARTLKDIGLESWNPDLVRRMDLTYGGLR